MQKFTPRLKKPEAGDPYFNTKSNGGYSPCIVGSPTDKGCNVLANCVGYGVGEFNSEIKAGKIKYLGTMNAESLYKMAYKWGLETGQEPKLGAMICWEGIGDGKGHVAIVEENNNGTLTLSESGYKSYIWRTRKINNKNGNWGAGSKYKFQGFIYNPELYEVTQPVDRNEDVNQLKILKSKLRIRTEPNLNGTILDFAVKDGIYNDLETAEADGYIWHKIAEYNWLAQVDGYVELLPKVEFRVGDIVKLIEPIEFFQITNIENNKVSIIPITDLNNIKKVE